MCEATFCFTRSAIDMDQQLIKAAQDGNDAMVASILGQNPGLINAKSSVSLNFMSGLWNFC